MAEEIDISFAPVTSQPIAKVERDWNDSLFDCTHDVKNCTIKPSFIIDF